MTMNAIIAVNPQQMQEAQATTQGWIGAKLADAQRDLALAQETLSSLHNAGLRTNPAASLITKAHRRIKFYEKVQAALQAGYVIIPPFDIQLFAVRTDHSVPDAKPGAQWDNREQAGRALPVGVGEYRNPAPLQRKIGKTDEPNYNDPTKTHEVAIYGATKWQDEIDLPVRAMKPTIIEAVGRALEQKIFDALGIAPAYRAADPIIAGQIRRPDGKGVLTFFVAWWLDEQDL